MSSYSVKPSQLIGLVWLFITSSSLLALGDEIGMLRGWWHPHELSSATWGRTLELQSEGEPQLNQLHHLVWSNNIAELQQLSQSQLLAPLINQLGQSGQGAIHLVRSPAMLQLLLDLGANPSLSNHFGDTALLLMVQRNRYSMVKMLLNAGADPQQANSFGETPLSEADWRKHQPIHQLLQHHAGH